MWQKLIFAVLLGGMLAGCSTFYSMFRAEPMPVTAFLPDHQLLARQDDTFPFHYFYLKRTQRQYSDIYVAPVDMAMLRESPSWREFDKALSGRLEQEVDELGVYMRQTLAEELRKADATDKLNVVDDTRQPGTLVLATAVTAIIPTKSELNYLGVAVGLVVPGASLVAGHFASGAITVEAKLYDAKTGEILMMYADTESDQRALINLAGFTWYGSAKLNIQSLARETARVLGRRDLSTLERDFPFHFVAY